MGIYRSGKLSLIAGVKQGAKGEAQLLTKEQLHKLFDYKDGQLFWKMPKRKNKIGTLAGTVTARNYTRVQVGKKIYYAHRIIFMMHYGYLPAEIDHIDNNPANNCISNLRAASHKQNMLNRKLSSNSTSNHKNVNWKQAANKWVVRIVVAGKRKTIGYFEDIELANLVAQEARNKYHGAFARH